MATQTLSRIVPRRLAENEASLSGTVALSEMARLRETVSAAEGEARYGLRFYMNGANRPAAAGEVSAEVVLTCQRCTAEFDYPLAAHVLVEVVDDADADVVDEHYEPWVAAGPVSLTELIETELLMALPFAPAHADGECDIDTRYDAALEEMPRKESPFAALKGLIPDQ